MLVRVDCMPSKFKTVTLKAFQMCVIQPSFSADINKELITLVDCLLQDYAPWDAIDSPYARYLITLNKDQPLNWQTPTSLQVETTSKASTQVGIQNPGFWGISTVHVQYFTFSFWAYSSTISTVNVSIVSSKNGMVYSTVSFTGIKDTWTQVASVLNVQSVNDPIAIFTVTWNTFNQHDQINFDAFTMYVDDGWRGLPFIRPDLADMVANMHPSIFRFPGGYYISGDIISYRFEWKNTIGPVSQRRGHYNPWGYYSEDGLGVFEYFSFLEKLTDVYGNPTRGVWVINAGITNNEFIPFNHIGAWVQDALDSIEFAVGNTSTKFGKIRAEMGHPQPFRIDYLAIGNENCQFGGQPYYTNNYPVFYNAIRLAYPAIKLISNCNHTGPFDYYDYHTYPTSEYFISSSDIIDTFLRDQQVFVSEYASRKDSGNGNLLGAIGEAVWMNSMERNGDVIHMASYAPLFVNANDRNWNPNAIVFDSSQSYGTPSYWNQVMYSNSFAGALLNSVKTLKYTLSSAANFSVSICTSTLNQTESKNKNGSNTMFIVKVVNTGTNPLPINIAFTGLGKGDTFPALAELMTLTSKSPDDENSFANPTLIAPVSSQIKAGSNFTLSTAPYSINIVRVFALVAS